MEDLVERSRTVTWDDPRAMVRAGREVSGVEFLRAMMRGEVPGPPMAALLGLEIDEVDEGRVVFGVVPGEYHYNPAGVVHGGLLATLCDSAMTCAVAATLPAGVLTTTVELKVNFVRPILATTGRLRCEGRVIHAGGRIATAEARVTDAAGTLYGHATTTCMILRPEQGREG
jgi:uncharacterized protein (TIGR00369 family)